MWSSTTTSKTGSGWTCPPSEWTSRSTDPSAVVSNLHGLSWLRVGAASCAGSSEWSQIEQLYGTNASDWEGVSVPEVEEGDQTEPCSEDADTPGNSPATGAPTISGTAQVGETLTANTSGVADADGLSSVQHEYQWLADDSEIAGATGSTYTLAAADEGKAIKVQVGFTDDADNEETLTSAATAAVVAAVAQPTAPPDQPTGLEATATHDSGDPHLGRPRGRLHHRLRDTAPRPRERYRGRLQRTGGGHQHGGADLHRQHGGGRPHLHLPHQGHQRAWGERAFPLVPHRHSGSARTRPAHGPRSHGDPRLR